MPDTALTILMIDDDPGDRELLRRQLVCLADFNFEFLEAGNAQQGMCMQKERNVDATILDYRLGAMSGMDVLERIRASGDIRPVIVLTGQGDEYVAAQLMRSGADDYLVKSDLHPDVLRRSLANSRARFHQRKTESQNRRLLAELKEANDLLAKQNARLDELYKTAHQFVDDVSHEFRTPLTVIKGYTEAMEQGLAGPLNEQQAEFVGIVIDRARDLSQMVDDLLDTSKIRSGYLRVDRRGHSIHEIVESIRPLIDRKATTEKINLEEKLPDNLPEIFADKEKVGRVIVNLVVNAVKFSPENSKVVMWARPLGETEVEIGVTDEGPGISEENLKKLFARFSQVGDPQRSSTKGFGLGLSIAKELVTLNLGTMSVLSQVGNGSTFAFTLPVNDSSVIVDHMFARLANLQKPAGKLAVIRVTPKCDDLPIEKIREFLASITHPMDVIQSSHTRRVLTLLGYTNDPENWIERLRESGEKTISSSPDRSSYEVNMELLGAWAYPGEKEAVSWHVVKELTGVRKSA